MKLARMIITASAVLAIGLAAGCKKDEKKADPAAAPAPKAGDTPAAPAPADDKPADPAPAAAEPAAADPAPAAADLSVDEMGPKAIAMMESMAKAVSDNKGDCDKQADALQKILDDNKAMMASMKAFDSDKAKKKEFEEKYGDKAMGVMGGVMGELMACKDNEKLKKVFEAFE